MIATLKDLSVAVLDRDRVGAMAADVHERVQLALEVAGHHDRNLPDLTDEVIAWVRELCEAAGVLPGPSEDLLDLERVDVGVRIPPGRERHVRESASSTASGSIPRSSSVLVGIQTLRFHGMGAAKSRKSVHGSYGAKAANGNADFAVVMRQMHHTATVLPQAGTSPSRSRLVECVQAVIAGQRVVAQYDRDELSTRARLERATSRDPWPTRCGGSARRDRSATSPDQARRRSPPRPRGRPSPVRTERSIASSRAWCASPFGTPANRPLVAYRSVERHRTLPAVERQTARTAEPPPSAPRVKPRRLRRATELRRRRKLDAHSPAVALRFLGLGCTVDA